MPGMNKLVLASSNPGKLREFEALLAPLGMEVVPQASLGVSDAEEPHGTFVENALAKARHASRRARLPALADDSGLCAGALGGQPGVHSARFALDAPQASGYYCVIVLMRHAKDPEPVMAEGSWAGEIVAQPRGANGFGYDPYFFLRDLGKTAAELDPEQKNLVSHRGKAMRRLLAKLKEGAWP